MRKNNPELKPLPAAFYIDRSVDLELLKHLFQESAQPSRFSKKIAHLIQHKVPRNHEERLELIGRNLSDSHFRARWYAQMDTKKSRDKHWGPLFQLIANWVYTSVPELTLNDPEQRRLLFIQDNKRSEFIRPTAISTLLDITTNAGVDSRTTALFLWASAEAAAWRNYKPAQFDVDYIISNSVDQEHVAEYCFKVTKLFSEPVTLTADHVDLEEDTHLAGEEESNHGMLASDETQEGGAESVDLVGHDAGDEKDSEFITQLPNRLANVDGAWKAYLSMIDEMVSAIAKLQRKPASTVIISSLETLASSIKEGWPLVQESMDSYSTLFQKSIRNLGRMTISREDLVVHMPTTNTQDIDKWLRQQANELEAYKECEEALVNYQDCTTKMKNHGIPENWEGPFEGLSSLTAWLNSSIEAGEKQWREQEIIECFKHHCSEASLNLNWNPFSDDVIKRDEWASLCSSLQKQIVTPYLLGVALRVLLDTKSTEYVHLVGDILENWREDFVRTSKILSVLSSIQIERLWDDDVQMRPALVLCILNSWLNACDNNDQSGIDYWYQKPLKVVSAKSGGRHVHVSGSVYKFLHELKVLVRQGDICSSGRWQRIIADVGDGAARAHADYLYDQMKQRVLVPPNYGGNYGYIAVNIYEELFLPLHEAVLARNMDGVRSQLSELRTKFDFGKWFARNSGQYQRHGHIASEHKKKIQYYIDDRLNCIDEWLDAEYDTTSERGDQIRNVQSAVDKLLAEYEQQGSQTPDEYLATIGWWVNELRRDGAVPVPSAGNSTGVLSGMSVPSILINEHEFPWRCIEAQVTGLTPKWEAYAADALSIWSHPDVETSVLQHWRDEDRIECIRSYVQRSERGGNVVSREMKQWLTEREEKLKGFLILDIKEIQSKMEGFQSDIKQLYQEELDDIKQHFNSGNWYDLRTRTKSLKEAVCSALDSYGNDEKRQQLCDDITYLGGTACNESELVELETELNKLLSAAEDRMVHIKVLGNLLQLPELPENLRDEIADIIQMLKQPRYLPTADRADWLKCILETSFSLLTEHLAKPGILLPEYRNLLLQLLRGLMQLLSNQEWILQQDSEAEKLLLQVSDRLDEEHSIDSVQSIKQFLAWLSEQSEGFNFPTFDIDSDVPRNEYGVQEDDTVMPPGIDDDVSSEKAKRTLTEALLRFSDGLADIPASEGDDEEIGLALSRKSWDEVARLCVARARLEKEKQFSDIFFVSAGLSLAYVLTSKDRSDVVEALLFLVDHIGTNGLPKTLTKKTQRTEKPPLGVVAASWLIGQDVDNVSTWRHDDEVIGLAAVRLARVLKVNSNDVSGKFSSPVLDALWDYALGETWGADFRACLLHICTRGGLLGALVFLLKKDPVKMQEQRAKLFAGLVGRATDVPGWERLTGFLESERNKQRSKPFALFAEQLLALSKRRKENPATIEVVGPVEKGQEKNVWIAVIQVVPSVLDPPQDIVLRVPKNSPVTFGTERRLTQYIEGPFLDRQQIRIALNFKETFRSKIPVEVQCRIKTLQDVQTDFMLTWTIDTEKTEDNFVALDPSSIEQCFNRFPYSPMRGKDYVPRDADEKTIEEMLFNSQQAGSLWITSPRRSGKTTMLFRILDEFSYKKGRDDIILYFTLDSPIESKKAFNSWIWRRILKARENRELKNYIPNLKEIGTTLDMDDDVDIFLSDIAEGLLKNVLPGARVYFVIDEIDRFAEMFLTGGAKRDMALSIMWQLRNLISSETTVGILFAGSHAARRFFVSDSSAPFYNSIAAINLEPFNVDTQQRESRTRAIVQPKNLADVFTVSKDTLRHLLRITAGIPYYMKLLAGATFTCAKHSQILPADVNEGVTRMLAKETGIGTIDMLENPGEDELRTLYAESTSEKALIKGVLLAVANIRSPLSGHPVNVGEIWSERSPLVVRAGLSKEMIEPALTSARDMGFLLTSSSSEYQVEFAIPLLGESMRRRFNVLWASIEYQLEKIGGH